LHFSYIIVAKTVVFECLYFSCILVVF
jgi:hypothetical protein